MGPLDNSMIALRAHISEATPRDLRGVETLIRVAESILGVEPRVIEGRQGPFSDASWEEDLAASRGVLAGLGDAPVYLHLDPDVLDPSVNPVPYARPGGLSAEALRVLLSAVAARRATIGVEITAFHSPDDPADRDKLGEFLIDAVAPLLAQSMHIS